MESIKGLNHTWNGEPIPDGMDCPMCSEVEGHVIIREAGPSSVLESLVVQQFLDDNKIVPDDMLQLWRIIKDWSDFWADEGVRDYTGFRWWWTRTVKYALVAEDHGKVVGCAYLDNIYPGFYATVNIFKRKDYLNPDAIAAITRTGLPRIFNQFKLEKLVGLTRHTAATGLALAIGFKINGVVRNHARVNGEWTDYTLLSILKEEVDHDFDY